MAAIDTAVDWKVTILGQDVSSDVEAIDSIVNTLDVPNLTEYTVSDVSLRLMPNRYEWSPSKSSNFFTQQTPMHVQSGYRARITIEGGFRGETLRSLFSGEIVEVTQILNDEAYRVIATDRSRELREDEITDFGIRKNNTIPPTPDRSSIRGQFDFAEPVIPVSRESVSAKLSGSRDTPNSTDMTFAENFADEGMLDEKKFRVSDDGSAITTETAPVQAQEATLKVNATYKAPLRGVSIERVVRELLNRISLTANPTTIAEDLTLDGTQLSGTPPTGITNPSDPDGKRLTFRLKLADTVSIVVDGTDSSDEPIYEVVSITSSTWGITTQYFKTIRSIRSNKNLTPNNPVDIGEASDIGEVNLQQMTSSNLHWSHFARPAYEIESARGNNNTIFGWNGYVTDYVRNTNGDMYFLYSHWGGTLRPQLIKYTAATDTWGTVYQASDHAEWWQLATDDYNEFFIIQTNGSYERGVPRLGTYNPAEGSAQTSILKVNATAGTATLPYATGTFRPQMAVHYWYGFVSGTGNLRVNNSRFGFLPDTRTGFHVAENAVWYRYANSTQFGLARIRASNGTGEEAVITINRDEFGNEASFDFTLDVSNRTIYGAHTSIGVSSGTLKSRLLVYSKSMPTSF